jgi:hypothetical protein
VSTSGRKLQDSDKKDYHEPEGIPGYTGEEHNPSSQALEIVE